MSLTPDVERDSVIVLKLHVPGNPFFTRGRRLARHRLGEDIVRI